MAFTKPLRINKLNQKRCAWCGIDPLYVAYHDTTWGRPVADSLELFEKLCLDGQQAGLSWITILRKQQNYRDAFQGFNPEILASWGESEVAALMTNSGIVRNRLKIQSIIKNARAYLILSERETFSHYLWCYLDGQPHTNYFSDMSEIPTITELSEKISKNLKKVGFTFVGGTIIYAFMQAVGMVNDHLVTCPQHQQCKELGDRFSI
jgi:DNA-3-methyladenine glycosylase I